MEAAIDTTLRRLARDGFPRAQVEAVVHQIELDDREVSPSFGIGVGISCMSSWLHGGSPGRNRQIDLRFVGDDYDGQ